MPAFCFLISLMTEQGDVKADLVLGTRFYLNEKFIPVE